MHKFIKGEEHSIINLVNYMSDPFPPYGEFMFRGFVPLQGQYFGLHHKGVDFAAVHLSTVPVKRVRSDECDREEKMIQSGKRWLALFYGSDNTSYMKRFDSKERMEKWFNKTEKLVWDNSWLFYNS